MRRRLSAERLSPEYKEIRPVVQFGDLYRLVSPYDNQGLSSIMYVSEAKDKAVFYWWKLANFYNVHFQELRWLVWMRTRCIRYVNLMSLITSLLTCEGKSYSGKYLMEHGLEMPYVHEVDWGKRTTGLLVFSIWRLNKGWFCSSARIYIIR